MKNTFEKWAGWYDYMFKERQEDIRFYVNEAKKVKGKVLEIACGTGRIYLEMLRNGIDAYGIDISNELLNVLKEKARKEGLKPKVYRQDMRNFKLEEKFDLIMIPFRSFLHNLTQEDQISTLRNVHNHLNEEGKLILNFFFPNYEFMHKNFGKVINNFEFERDNKKYVVKSYNLGDEINQIIEFDQIIVEKETGKELEKMHFTVRYIYKNEFELLLRLAGFSKWNVYGGFNYEPLKTKEQEMVWVVEK